MIAIVFAIIGLGLMLYWNKVSPMFFKLKPQVADPQVLTGEKQAVASFAAEEEED